MSFGDYLRERRTTLGWTQPEAASRIGIEQSYLSKLETGKSIPSEEIYGRLSEALGLDTSELVARLSGDDLERLGDIQAIKSHAAERKRSAQSITRRWLVAGLAMLMSGGGLFGLAQIDGERTVQQFTYQSTGVILPGESLDVFSAIGDAPAADAPNYQDRIARQRELLERIDERTRDIREYRGPTFIENVPDGRRLWRLVGGSEETIGAVYAWALVPAFALLVGALGCFFVWWRWRS